MALVPNVITTYTSQDITNLMEKLLFWDQDLNVAMLSP